MTEKTCFIDGCHRPKASKRDLLCVAHKHRLVEHGAVLGDIPIGGAPKALRRIAYDRRLASPEGVGLQSLDASPLLDGVELIFTGYGFGSGNSTPEGIYAGGADGFEWGVWSGTRASNPRLIGPFARLYEAQAFLRQRKGGVMDPAKLEPVFGLLPRYHPDVVGLDPGLYVDPDIPGVYIAVMEGPPHPRLGVTPRTAIATTYRELAGQLANAAPEVMTELVELVRERDEMIARWEIARRITREAELDAYERAFGETHPTEARGEAMPREDMQRVVDASMARRRAQHVEA